MGARPPFRTADSRYTRAQLQKIYTGYARLQNRMTHPIMAEAYIDAWLKNGSGPMSDALDAYLSSQAATKTRESHIYRLALMAAVALAIVWA